MAFVLLLLFFAACSSREAGHDPGTYVFDFAGAVASDEPRATRVARNVLLTGGNAADAATALYFTLSVTMPGAAGLGGGGVCLAGDVASGKIEALDFRAPAPARMSSAQIDNAVPTNPLGFYALHARYGRKNWSEVLIPAERLARFGTRISRATATHLASAGDFSGIPDLAQIFSKPAGGSVEEGDYLQQEDLSATLSNLREMGPRDFYTGRLASHLVDATINLGGSLSLNDLSQFRPQWREVRSVAYGNMELLLAPASNDGAISAAVLWRMLDEVGFDGASETDRAHMQAEMALRSLVQIGGDNSPDGSIDDVVFDRLLTSFDANRHLMVNIPNLPLKTRREEGTGTGFVVVDPQGGAVACSVSMNQAFGAKKMLPGMGFLLASNMKGDGGSGTMMASMALRNRYNKTIYFLGAVGDGLAEPSSLVSVAARVVMGKQSLNGAMAAPRIFNPARPDATFYEKRLAEGHVAALKEKGHRLFAVKNIGRVNAISCAQGVPSGRDSCRAMADPRGYGIAFEGR